MWVRLCKVSSLALMAFSFIASVIVVFVATETGTQMLGKGAHQALCSDIAKRRAPYNPVDTTPVKLFVREYEMEYALVRGGFFNSLVFWLGAIAAHFGALGTRRHRCHR